MAYHALGIVTCPVSGAPVPQPRFFWTELEREGPYPNACASCSTRHPATVADINDRRSKAHQDKVRKAARTGGKKAAARARADAWRHTINIHTAAAIKRLK